jgi:hypothetical protein
VTFKVFFTYVDWTLETPPRAFYVGKGQLNRVNLAERNFHWRNIAAKHGWQREVVLATKDEAYAFEQEILGILELGTFVNGKPGRWGANKTAGGEGATGAIKTEKQLEMMRGENNPSKRLDVARKISQTKTGSKASLATREKMSSTHKRLGRFGGDLNPAKNPVVRERWSENRKGKSTGFDNPAAKLTWERVADIRRLRSEGWSHKMLSHAFSITVHSIAKIVTNRSWILP